MSSAHVRLLLLLARETFLLLGSGVCLLVKSAASNFVDILGVGDGLFFAGVAVGLLFAKDGPDLVVELVTAVAHEQNLQGLFDGDASAEVLVVHEESDKIVELAWLQILHIADAALVHGLELLLRDVTVQIVIDLLRKPNQPKLEITHTHAGGQEEFKFQKCSFDQRQELTQMMSSTSARVGLHPRN